MSTGVCFTVEGHVLFSSKDYAMAFQAAVPM